MVNLAIDLKTKEKVAIKKINQFLENKHESIRILREILLLKNLKHPNIIGLKNVLIHDKDCKEISLVLDYCPTDIKRVFKSNREITLLDMKQIIYQLLAGLEYCQQCQVIHRDLKPENILVTSDFRSVKLCDFGLARAIIFD